MSLKDKLNPFKKPWWKQDEWYEITNRQNAFEIEEEYESSWDLKFWFVAIYRHKDSGEIRCRKDETWVEYDKTVFEAPEEFIKDYGGSETHYLLIGRDIEIYEGPDYE
jgi:hypothetical protein